MTDDDKKRIVSEPPPPTDEIDGEWGDEDQTLVRDAPVAPTPSQPAAPASAPEAVTQSQPAPPAAAVGQTAVAPISEPPKAAASKSEPPKPAAPAAVVEEDDEEDEEDAAEDEEYDDEDEEYDGASAQPTRPEARRASGDWIPEWGPFAVLAVLVTVSIVFGLGLVGGPESSVSEEEAAAPAASVKPQPSALKAKPARPSGHP